MIGKLVLAATSCFMVAQALTTLEILDTPKLSEAATTEDMQELPDAINLKSSKRLSRQQKEFIRQKRKADLQATRDFK